MTVSLWLQTHWILKVILRNSFGDVWARDLHPSMMLFTPYPCFGWLMLSNCQNSDWVGAGGHMQCTLTILVYLHFPSQMLFHSTISAFVPMICMKIVWLMKHLACCPKKAIVAPDWKNCPSFITFHPLNRQGLRNCYFYSYKKWSRPCWK